MPLTHDVDAVVVSKCGWAFSSLTRPCVAQRVWPMPVVAGRVATATRAGLLVLAAETASRRRSRLPTARTDSIASPAIMEMPAES